MQERRAHKVQADEHFAFLCCFPDENGPGALSVACPDKNLNRLWGCATTRIQTDGTSARQRAIGRTRTSSQMAGGLLMAIMMPWRRLVSRSRAGTFSTLFCHMMSEQPSQRWIRDLSSDDCECQGATYYFVSGSRRVDGDKCTEIAVVVGGFWPRDSASGCEHRRQCEHDDVLYSFVCVCV